MASAVYAHRVILIVYSIMALHSLILYGVSLTPISLVILASAVFSIICRFVFERHKSKSMPLLRQRTFFFVVVVILSSAVLAIVMIADGSVPYLLLGWLPYRLMNHLAPILLIMCVILLSDAAAAPSKRSSVVPYLLPALLLFHLAKPLYPFVFGESFYSRYLLHNDSVFFVLVGAAASVLLYDSREEKSTFYLFTGSIIAATGAVATLHQFGAACFAASAIGVYGLLRSALRMPRAGSKAAIYVLGTVVLVFMMKNEYGYRRHLPIGAFEAEVARILDDEGNPEALVAARPDQVLFQAQTGHPVISDMATEFHASYRPSLGPSVQKLYEEVYGIWFEERDSAPPLWQSVWNERTPSEWSALGARYGFEYLVVPNDVHPQATLILEGELNSLYRIP